MMRAGAPAFDASRFSGRPDVVRKYQKKYAERFRAGQRVLELGCGRGVFLELLSERSVRGAGVDCSASAVAACRAKKLDAVQADALDFLRRTKRTYDGVFCAHLVEHVPPDRAIALFREVRRVLADRGLFIVVTPNVQDVQVWSETFWLDVSHVRPYPRPLVEEMFRFAGFDIETSGEDPDTGIKPGRRNFFRYFLYKLRFGAYYGRGDTVVTGRKGGVRAGVIRRS